MLKLFVCLFKAEGTVFVSLVEVDWKASDTQLPSAAQSFSASAGKIMNPLWDQVQVDMQNYLSSSCCCLIAANVFVYCQIRNGYFSYLPTTYTKSICLNRYRNVKKCSFLLVRFSDWELCISQKGVSATLGLFRLRSLYSSHWCQNHIFKQQIDHISA